MNREALSAPPAIACAISSPRSEEGKKEGTTAGSSTAASHCAGNIDDFLGVVPSQVGIDGARGSLALMSNESMIRGGGPEAWRHLDLADEAKSKPLLPSHPPRRALFLPPPRLIRVSYSSCFKALRSARSSSGSHRGAADVKVRLGSSRVDRYHITAYFIGTYQRIVREMFVKFSRRTVCKVTASPL